MIQNETNPAARAQSALWACDNGRREFAPPGVVIRRKPFVTPGRVLILIVSHKMKSLRLTLAAVALAFPGVGFAKRDRPQAVESVLTSTLRIVAPLDDGKVARIHVFERSEGRLLWSLVVFENKIDPGLEEDAQWRFIRSMKIVGDALEIVAEGGRRYRVILATRKVELLTPPTNRLTQ